MTDIENRTLSDKFMLRLPDGMRDRIRLAAEENGRSMNSEILAVLEKAFPELSPFEENLAKVRRMFEAASPEERAKYVEAIWGSEDTPMSRAVQEVLAAQRRKRTDEKG